MALALFTLSIRVVSAPGSVALVLDALLVAIWAVGLAVWFRTGRDAAPAPRRGSPQAAAHGGEGAAQ